MVGLCGDESHQSFAPEHGHGTRAALVAACAADSKTAEKRHRSRGDAGRMGPASPPRLKHRDESLSRPTTCSELPHPASAAGHSRVRDASNRPRHPQLEAATGTVARSPASARSRHFAHRSARRRSSDRGRSDPCSRDQHGSSGRFFVRFAVAAAPGALCLVPLCMAGAENSP
eukprot:COSAG02_NODE_6132_length_3778_cov_194.586794_1_plen_173_part_00